MSSFSYSSCTIEEELAFWVNGGFLGTNIITKAAAHGHLHTYIDRGGIRAVDVNISFIFLIILSCLINNFSIHFCVTEVSGPFAIFDCSNEC